MWKPTEKNDKKKPLPKTSIIDEEVEGEEEQTDESIDEEAEEVEEEEAVAEKSRKIAKVIKQAVKPEETIKYIFIDQNTANKLTVELHAMITEMYQDWKKTGL